MWQQDQWYLVLILMPVFLIFLLMLVRRHLDMGNSAFSLQGVREWWPGGLGCLAGTHPPHVWPGALEGLAGTLSLKHQGSNCLCASLWPFSKFIWCEGVMNIDETRSKLPATKTSFRPSSSFFCGPPRPSLLACQWGTGRKIGAASVVGHKWQVDLGPDTEALEVKPCHRQGGQRVLLATIGT